MNLLGISWGMGARDVGMKAAVTGAQNNLDQLNKSLDQQSKIAGKSKGPGFWAKMKEGVARFNLASIASDVRSLTGDTGNLSNSLESMAVANAKAAKPFVASLNLTGAEMKRMTSRISGMAIGMNVGAESVAEVFKAMAQATGPAKEALDALGYSEKDWVKISETTGIKIGEMTDAFGGMGALWKAAPKDEAIFLNRLVEIGKKAGLGVQPVKSLKQSLEEIGNPFEKLPPEMQRTGAEMMGLVESSARLGGVFREMGSSEEEATTLGVQTAKMFGEQAVAIERAQKYGLNALDESPLFKWLTQLGVGYAEATNIVETGSRDAVKGTQMIQDQFKRFGMGGAQQQAMLAELSGALGESAAGLGYLAQNTDTGAKALARMNALTVTGKDSLKKYADQAFSSGRTLQESYDLAKEAFDTQIRSISRKDVVGLIGSKMGAFREVGKEMKALAEEGGPMSMLVRGMSTFKQMGIQGVFLQVGKAMGMDVKAAQKMSIKLGLGIETLQGFAQELGPLMNMLGQFGPMGIAAGGIAGFFLLDDADRAKIIGALEPMWEKVKQGASDIWYGTEGKTGLKDGLAKAWTSFMAWFRSTGMPMLAEGLQAIGGILMNIIDVAMQDPKIGIAATIGAGLLVGGKFGAFGAVVGLTSGAIMAAISEAEAEVKRLKEQQETNRKTQELLAKKAAKMVSGGESKAPESEWNWEYDVGMDQSEVGWYQNVADLVAERTQDFAAKWAKDTDAQLGLVERQGQEVRAQLTEEMGGFLGTLAGGFVEDSMAAIVKRNTGAGDDLGFWETMMAPDWDFMGVGEHTTEMMSGYGESIAATQSMPGGQEYLTSRSEGSSTPETYAMAVQGLPAMLKEMASAQGQVFGAVQQTVVDTQAMIDGATASMAVSSTGLGTITMSAMAQAISDTGPGVGTAMVGALKFPASCITMHSPIGDGPLAGVGGEDEGDPAYMAGMTLMTSFAAGIDAGAMAVTESMVRMLDESVFASIDAYQVELQKATANKGLLSQVAGMLMREFGANIESTVTVDGQAEDVRATMKAMLNVPGLAGVTMAIINESAKQRRILDKIRENTETMAKVVSDKGGKPAFNVVLPS